ncbi:unnamed protein product [Effrenium voratum]|nr:unnamed protein product [Effrenium voratum]
MANLEGLNDFQLFKACGPLYPVFALESLASVLMGVFFCYLALRIAVRTEVNAPAWAMYRWFFDTINPSFQFWWKDACSMGMWLTSRWQEVKNWPKMCNRPLADRVNLCQMLNLAMVIAQAAAFFMTAFRWLHIQNVNGLRYLAYAFTCAVMQAELVILIAPYVPCFRFNVIAVVMFTHAWMILGWIGSLQSGMLFEDASWEEFIENYDWSVLVVTNKGLLIGSTTVGMFVVMFIQMPFLLLMYFLGGGCRAHPDLPYYYLRLLAVVWTTWPAFPAWWLVSAEGLGLLSDAKSNAVGFGILNICSKGAFTYFMLKIYADYQTRFPKPDVGQKPPEPPRIVKALQEFDSDDGKALITQKAKRAVAKAQSLEPVKEEAKS